MAFNLGGGTSGFGSFGTTNTAASGQTAGFPFGASTGGFGGFGTTTTAAPAFNFSTAPANTGVT
ncbi:hypothetical protein scyTo_0020019, partial [Scyliorhinus torazame]|nr:hypothetical protein [Scyliorhinus torazame]